MKPCYLCDAQVTYLFADARCVKCTRLTPDEVTGMDDPQYVDVECKIKHETDKAYLIEYDEDEEGDAMECWVPKSQVGQIIKNGTTITMEIAEWFAEREGLV